MPKIQYTRSVVLKVVVGRQFSELVQDAAERFEVALVHK
jgi:hypothetical protein